MIREAEDAGACERAIKYLKTFRSVKQLSKDIDFGYFAWCYAVDVLNFTNTKADAFGYLMCMEYNNKEDAWAIFEDLTPYWRRKIKQDKNLLKKILNNL